MAGTISSLADTSSVLYVGRAGKAGIVDISGMKDELWKKRLEAGMRDRKMSKRAVSLKAGLGPGYVHSILKEGEDPTINNLIDVCAAAGLSLSWVLFGVEISRSTEEIVKTLEAAPLHRREAILSILRDEAD